jgi:hypothetical protein
MPVAAGIGYVGQPNVSGRAVGAGGGIPVIVVVLYAGPAFVVNFSGGMGAGTGLQYRQG